MAAPDPAAARVPARPPHKPDPPAPVHRPQQRAEPERLAPPRPSVVAPLLEQRALLDAGRAPRLRPPAAAAERGLVEDRRVVVVEHAGFDRPHEIDPPAR